MLGQVDNAKTGQMIVIYCVFHVKPFNLLLESVKEFVAQTNNDY